MTAPNEITPYNLYQSAAARGQPAKGARVRFRPVLMTSCALSLGLSLLVVASGSARGAAGSGTIGARALGGVSLETGFGVVVVSGPSLSFRVPLEGNSLIKKEEEADTSVTEEVAYHV